MAPENPTTSATFPQFSKLATEIRYKIWMLTLKPRVVEIKYHSPQDTTPDGYDWWKDAAGLSKDFHEYTEGSTPGIDGYEASWEVSYYSNATLPVAFYVCNDSRRAILPFYPTYFASESTVGGIHFNFNLDTLYMDHVFTQLATRFFGGLQPHELQNIRHLALSEECGNFSGSPDSRGDFWINLESALDTLSSLKEFKLVVAVFNVLRDYYPRIPHNVAVEYIPTPNYQIELYDDFPEGIDSRPEIHGHLRQLGGIQLSHNLGPATEWIAKKEGLNFAYGWTRAPPAQYI